MRSRLAQFHCPACAALQPYAMTRRMAFVALEEKKPAVLTCSVCKADFKLHAADPQSRSPASRIWGFASVAAILLGLAAFAVIRNLLPAGLEWIAAAVGLALGLGPLPYIEAFSSRHIGVFKQIKRRKQ